MKWLSMSLLFLPLLTFAEQTGFLVIKTDPEIADIFVDGEFKANSSKVIVEVPAGSHDIKVTQGNRTTVLKNIKISAGTTVIKELKLNAPVIVNDLADSKVFRDVLAENGSPCDFCPEMVWIPAGTFKMGSNTNKWNEDWDQKPAHDVNIRDLLAIGIYEITFEQYDYFANATGRQTPSDNNWGRYKHPVINVSWDDATAYAAWLSQVTGYQYRLPTEAEWEYVARAGTMTNFWWGNDLLGKANCYGNNNKTLPIGSFNANKFGLYDTVGNVWEWTCSEYDKRAYETNSSTAHLKCSQQSGSKVLRGGSWNSNKNGCRVTYRLNKDSTNKDNMTGFRVVRLAD
ncbi:hypothetical protein BegalDRAFT_2898 [Beggiatoa alba B18LD]|uniref:Sulfatase-modifying factor enzyme domain-containing protein n=1 Tax=Beggiatoa alba B18LD TaxID=395493 RepID=I3CJD3_9GAMM|nr:SUMF1/EgtB/PvdO family nonheme iron enzyme [Beggiatoa alba]EIJ43726.1 hypothetical protein BegalDRAFT_2898 [Beggiatoa alba B18LD]